MTKILILVYQGCPATKQVGHLRPQEKSSKFPQALGQNLTTRKTRSCCMREVNKREVLKVIEAAATEQSLQLLALSTLRGWVGGGKNSMHACISLRHDPRGPSINPKVLPKFKIKIAVAPVSYHISTGFILESH